MLKSNLELEAKNKQLSAINFELTNTQSQLVEAEKMAANAKLAGNLGATSLLADLVEAMAQGTTIKEFKDQQA